ncbi:MAG: hypothetical protein H7X92_14620 [Chitinophagales bacterium]|nr:hypothetical protein [Hyphomicrobiales bacterium]
MDITRGFPPAMAFVSIFSYVAGLPAAIVFASCSSYKIAKYKSLSWRVTSFIIPIAAIVAFAWSSYILEMQGAPFVVKASLLAGVAAILSALFCRLLLEALQIIRPLMESELPDWVKPMSYIFLSVWFIIVVVGAEKLSRTNIAWP